MRRFAIPVLLVLASACGGSSTTSTTPTPAPGSPASVAIVSGDAQSAPPGSVLPVKLSVLVKDAAGLAVPGVTVRFSVDSGGGSLDLTSSVTGSNGVATSGSWTLGPSAGTNVVSAAVGTVTPVRFHAQAFGATARTLINNTVMGSGGGTLRYTKSGDALNGLTLTVPASAYATATTWTVVADSSIRVPLPSGLTQVGPVLVIGNGLGMADSLMTLTMPMHIAANMVVVPFYFDPASGTLEGIPLGGRTDSSTTLATGHFSVNEMMLPGVSGSLRSSLRAGFGSVEVVWVAAPLYALAGTQASTFYPGVDDWEFPNNGDYAAPDGDCEGMTITAMYYHYLFRATGGSNYLYHHFDKSLPNLWDNVQGIRYAGSVQGDINSRYRSIGTEFKKFSTQPTTAAYPIDWLTANWVLLTLQVTHRPVLLGIVSEDGKLAHAVIAYSANFSVGSVLVSFADPNDPGNPGHTMLFGDRGLVNPVMAGARAGETPSAFTQAYAINVSGELPLEQLASRYAEFTNAKAGLDRYPSNYHVDATTDNGVTWKTLAATDEIWTTRTTWPQFKVRHVCLDCPVKDVDGTDNQNGELWNGEGSAVVSGRPLFPEGVSPWVLVLKSHSPYSTKTGPTGGSAFVDMQPMTVRYHPLSITVPAEIPINAPVTLALSAGTFSNAQSVYTWTITEGSTVTSLAVTGDPHVTHAFAAVGSASVSVELRDPVHGVLGTVTTTLGIGPITGFAWQFTSATLVNAQLPPGGIGPEASDTLVWNVFTQLVNNLQASPSNSLFYVSVMGDCTDVLIEQFPAGQFAPVLDLTFGGAIKGIMGYNCPTPDYLASFTMGPLGNGTLVGSAVDIPNPETLVLPGGSISATMAGTLLSGSFTWRVRFSTGEGIYSFNFQGVQVLPKP